MRYFSAMLFAASLAFLPFFDSALAAEPQLIIEDNDFMGPGGTNIQSALMLIGSPDVRVLGFTVVTGDGWRDEETAALLRVLEIAKRPDIPVVPGAVVPLVNSRPRMLAWEKAYGEVLWKGAWGEATPGGRHAHPTEPFLIPPQAEGEPTIKATSGTAAEFLIQQVHRHPHQVTILAAGPLTNIALAIRLDPAFATLAKELVFNGALLGTNSTPGDAGPDALFAYDFNIRFDPEAAQIVLTAPWQKITAVGDVTLNTMMTPQLLDRITAKVTPVTRYLKQYVVLLPLWDELTAAIAIDRNLVTKHAEVDMDVDLDHGADYGTIHVWPGNLAPHVGERKVDIAQSVDMERFLNEFVAATQFVASDK